MIPASSRIAPPRDPSRDVADLVALTAPPGRDAPGTIVVLAHRPELLGPFLGWAAALALQGCLPKRDHELLALRASYNCRSPFEWGEHAEFARAAGLSDEEIRRIATGPEAAGWDEHDAALLRLADELHATGAVTDRTWAELATRYDEPALVEALYVVGQYTMLSYVANAAAVPVPPGLAALPS